MRKLSFLFLCIMLGIGMMASPAAATVISLGNNEMHFYNYETMFRPDGAGGYLEYDFTGAVGPVNVGDIYVGIIGVQDVYTNGLLNWTMSNTDQLSGIFAQKVAEVILPDNGVPAGNPTPGGNQYDIINDWDSQPRIIFEAANTAATFTTLAGGTFTLGLTGDEIIALYHDTGATPLESDGTIVQDIIVATDGPSSSPWATFGYNTGVDVGMSSPEVAGDQDDTGYYYSYTSVFGTPVNNFTGEAWGGLDIIQNNTSYPMAGNLNDPGEGEMDVVIPGLLNDMFLSSEFEMYPNWLGSGMAGASSPWVFASNDPAWVGAVPEPATMLLLGSGLVGLAGFARRRSKKVS